MKLNILILTIFIFNIKSVIAIEAIANIEMIIITINTLISSGVLLDRESISFLFKTFTSTIAAIDTSSFSIGVSSLVSFVCSLTTKLSIMLLNAASFSSIIVPVKLKFSELFNSLSPILLFIRINST